LQGSYFSLHGWLRAFSRQVLLKGSIVGRTRIAVPSAGVLCRESPKEVNGEGGNEDRQSNYNEHFPANPEIAYHPLVY
jgi:hypothetical protein